MERAVVAWSEDTQRSTTHAVRAALYERQAASIGIPVNLVPLPPNPSNARYEETMKRAFERYHEREVDRVIFGDISLADVREYREQQLTDTTLDGVWPLWERDTTALATEFLDAGFKATVVAVENGPLDASSVGRQYDEAFLADLPPEVDPCGENGEFHTFVWDGPIFDSPIAVEPTETITRTVEHGTEETTMHYAGLTVASESSFTPVCEPS